MRTMWSSGRAVEEAMPYRLPRLLYVNGVSTRKTIIMLFKLTKPLLFLLKLTPVLTASGIGINIVSSKGLLGVIPSSVNATSSSKAGLAWSNGNNNDITQYTSTGKVSWYYTWSPNAIDSNLEFVPMLWGEDQVEAFSSSINKTITQNRVSAVLGMNEYAITIYDFECCLNSTRREPTCGRHISNH